MVDLMSQWQSQPLLITVILLMVLLLISLVSLLKLRRSVLIAVSKEQELGCALDKSQGQLEQALASCQGHERDLLRQTTVLEYQSKQLEGYKVQIEALTQTKEAYIKLDARFHEKERQLHSKEQLIDESKKTLLKEFELSANKLFEAKSATFQTSSKQNLENILSPFRQQLGEFNRQVDEVYHKENTQRNQLIGQITELQKQAQKISQDANNLTTALKGDNKVQGQWGEIVLERLLEESGLEKGREYHTQYNIRNEGKNFRPDVVIHLPDNKDIVIDSKVALVEYERFVSEGDRQASENSLKLHVDALKAHMKGLSQKSYESMEGLRTLDFVFMFVPIEAAFTAAIQHSPSLFKDAQEKKIMLVSPSSLMVALRTIETIWRYEKQNINAEKIAQSAGKLYDQFTLVMGAFEEVGVSLGKAGDSYDLVMKRLSQGRGNVMRRIDDLKKLGAKTSKPLPKASQALLDIETSKTARLLNEENET